MPYLTQRDAKKLADTGWQSWSTSSTQKVWEPPCNYNHKYSFITYRYPINQKKQVATGWCSWYAYGKNIDEKCILAHAAWIQKYNREKGDQFKLGYVLMDDGWCTWGDWMSVDKKKFPHGLSHISQSIRRRGLQPGIWIAPFLVDPFSPLVHSHPEWLVQKDGHYIDGLRISPLGSYLPPKKYLLDFTNPECRSYIQNSLDYLLKKCRFTLIKLDFLYALHAHPKLSSNDADRLVREFLSAIRKRYDGVYTIACGCPLLPAIGVVDSMRIGPDITLAPFLPFRLPMFLSSFYVQQVVLPTLKKRLWTKKFWHIDTDVFLCSPSNGISEHLIDQHAALTLRGGGNRFIGDNLLLLPTPYVHQYIARFLKKAPMKKERMKRDRAPRNTAGGYLAHTTAAVSDRIPVKTHLSRKK